MIGLIGRAPSASCQRSKYLAFLLSFSAGACLTASGTNASAPEIFKIEEATIGGIHAAFRTGTLTCRALVSEYLRRIDAYDRRGPGLTSIITINERALTVADSLDRRWHKSGPVGPLHCIPFVIKDNIATAGLRTTVGSAALAALVPTRDAFAVRRIREAGAVILAKGHLSEFAVSWARTAGSILPGETRNPYALEYSPAGSSGGVAAAVAANLAAAGLATETGKSIRGPAAFTALVGLRTTVGLISTAGVAPMRAATVGPMTRTVGDLAVILAVLVGVDPDDDATLIARRHLPSSGYSKSLRADGLRGARIGVARQADSSFRPDPEVMLVFEQALSDMRRLGAIIVDSIPVDTILNTRFTPSPPPGTRRAARPCTTFKFDLDDWLDRYATPAAPRFADILGSGRFYSSFRQFFERAGAVAIRPKENPACAPSVYADSVRGALLRVMDASHLDAVVYPTWVSPPSLVGGALFDDTEMLSLLPANAGFPSITLPMGYLKGRIPVGVELFARPWQEETLIRFAYAYERGTLHRRAPPSTPALR